MVERPRFIGTVRRECLNRVLVLGRRHLELVLAERVEHYNRHQPLSQQASSEADAATPARICMLDGSDLRRADVLDGPIHEYRLVS
ncbi:MAG: transposase [Actinomycetota bacterium]|nr:transposase [Actinomycetota bacterium]